MAIFGKISESPDIYTLTEVSGDIARGFPLGYFESTAVTPTDLNTPYPEDPESRTYRQLIDLPYNYVQISGVNNDITIIKDGDGSITGITQEDFEKQQAEGNFSLIGVPEGDAVIRNNVTGEIAK